jgi:cytochrome c biogenesis protein CcmG/thiol:disulfide interchange protein DsbE
MSSLASPDYAAALEAAPPALAAIYADGDAVLGGGRSTYERILGQAKGHPVVVNNWASWCVPCREEFPYFQAQAAEHLDEIAFLGVDSEDIRDAAETFLRDHPLPYPSVEAPGKRDFQEWIGRELVGYPNTVFYDENGKIVYAKQGPYADEAELARDIRKYALENG